MKFSLLQLFGLMTFVAVVVCYHEFFMFLGMYLLLPGIFITIAIFQSLTSKMLSFVAKHGALTAYRFGCLPLLYTFTSRSLVADRLNEHAVQHLEKSDCSKAIELASASIKINTLNAVFWFNRGVARHLQKQLEGAIEDYTRAIELYGDFKLAYRQRGCGYMELKRQAEGKADLTRYSWTEPDDYVALFYVGYLHEQAGQWELAIEALKESYALKPSHGWTVQSLSRIYAACPIDSLRDGTRALEFAKLARLYLGSQDWYALSVLAGAYAELGDFPNAVRIARETLELAPESEKATRRQRLEQYEQGIPYRLPNVTETKI